MTIQKVGDAAKADKAGKAAKPAKKGKGDSGKNAKAKGSNGAVLGAAAAGLAVGLAANFGRKAMVQGISVAAGDWFEALKTEHKLLLKIFDAMEKTENKQKVRRATLLMSMKHAIAKHAFEEENVVYCALRDSGREKDADKLNHEHGYVKQALYELTAMDKGSPQFLPIVRKLREDLEAHMRVEENEVFPALQAGLAAAGNKSLTVALNKEGYKVA